MRLLRAALFCLLALPSFATGEPGGGLSREREIRESIENYVRQKTAGLDCELRFRKVAFSVAPALPDGTLEYEIVAPQHWEGWGGGNLAVIVRKGDRVVRNIPVRVETEALVEMVVAARQLEQGSVVTAADTTTKRADIAAAQGRHVVSPGEVIGRRLRSTLRPNTPFRQDQLEKVPLIKSGQLITIVAENSLLKVTVTGKARSAGAEGDTITVQNLGSLKEFPARIVDANTVMVTF